MPCFRNWEGVSVTDLSSFPELSEALQRHCYAGVILFVSNIMDRERTVRLVSDLQANGAKAPAWGNTKANPYLASADQEGGAVARLSMGTRGIEGEHQKRLALQKRWWDLKNITISKQRKPCF